MEDFLSQMKAMDQKDSFSADKKAQLQSTLDKFKDSGTALYLKNDMEGAIKEYTKGIKFHGQHPILDRLHLLLSNRSQAYFRLEDYTQALKDAERCVGKDPAFVRGHERVGQAMVKLGRYKEAAQAYQRVIQLDESKKPKYEPLLKEVLTHVATVYSEEEILAKRQGLTDHQVDQLQQDLIKFKTDGNKLLNMKTDKTTEAAIQAYSAGIRLFNDSSPFLKDIHLLYSNRSYCYLNRNKGFEALSDGEECVRHKPDWHKGYARVGAAAMVVKNHKQAVEAYKKALELDPQNADYEDKLAHAQLLVEEEKFQLLASFTDTIKEMNTSTNMVKKSQKNFKVDHAKETKGWTKENQLARLAKRDDLKFLKIDPYWVFGLSKVANEVDVQERYKTLSRLLHPDKHSADDKPLARQGFDLLKEAQAMLKDPVVKKRVLDTWNSIKFAVSKERKLMRKKGLSEVEVTEVKGMTFDQQVDAELKIELAGQLHREEKRQHYEKTWAKKEQEDAKKESDHWRDVQRNEKAFQEQQSKRVKSWHSFNKKN